MNSRTAVEELPYRDAELPSRKGGFSSQRPVLPPQVPFRACFTIRCTIPPQTVGLQRAARVQAEVDFDQ